MDLLENSVKLVGEVFGLNDGLMCFLFLIEYFQCQSDGRFMDQYNCEKGKYFECIHYGQGMHFESFGLFFLYMIQVDQIAMVYY